MKPAVFLDRDGTVIEHVHHLVDPRDVRLIDGAGDALRKLAHAGFAMVLVTNQSVIGRGMIDEAGLAKVHQVLGTQLSEYGVSLDGVYFCPLVPGTKDQRLIEHPDRKPGPGMLLRAGAELNLDIQRSWMIGDSVSDMEAGRNAECFRTVLVRTGFGHALDAEDPAIDHAVADIGEAADLILREHASALST